MRWQLSIENVAGIRSGDATLEPGVNAVRASNWQGKSSFLASIETVFGTATPLTEGQETGRVRLETDDETYTVELERTDGTVSRSGSPYLTTEYDRVRAAQFAFLGEDNDVRRAVRNGDDLEAVLTRPLDFENIDEQIAALRTEREQIERELERAEEAADRLPQLQQRVTDLEAELDSLREARADLETEAADTDARQELSELRAKRDREEDRIERLETTAERIRETLAEKRSELDALTVPSDTDAEAELETVHDDLRDIERDLELLRAVYEANKRVLDEDRVELLTDVSHEMLSDSVACWLCGEQTSCDDIEAQLAALDQRITELRDRAEARRELVSELEATRDEIRTARRRESDLTDRIADLESRLAETEESLDAARETRADLESRIDDLAADVGTAQDRRTDLESEIKYLEAELADARDELETVESRADKRSMLEDEYDTVSEELTDLRNRKDDVKRQVRESFTAALEDLLDRFDTGFETARLTGTFDLVVARGGREAQIDALSEGERELLGLVAALAGHEAFDVSDRVPVLLLDGLGGLASDNLRVLVEYLRDRAPYLVLTAYPEHDWFEGHELSPAEWDVVSHGADTSAAQ
ncbi:archaea-specific SMC-related protein [Haloplanus aerogenes]|uniref:AAA domain-containing protein n=1 Tax=Haloplanus aerogenes TaxID=660522 RepID=A0A3M0DC44_9EURY|nr:archaea-specific SMC-related protein [Haloplanus aerogenes]AZH26426.1 ATPase [Haloplanus aerogenes]RMB18110.1 AAA domain-containing protein [Haloplanus aerogenes]